MLSNFVKASNESPVGRSYLSLLGNQAVTRVGMGEGLGWWGLNATEIVIMAEMSIENSCGFNIILIIIFNINSAFNQRVTPR